MPETVFGRSVPKQFAGSLFDLKPATSYEVRIRVQDPDGADTTLTATAATRAIPGGPANPRPISVVDAASFQSALLSAQPGDVITLQPGTYPMQFGQMYASGTAVNPIVIRGVNQSSVVLDGGNCADCNILEIYGSYVTVETMTFQNAFQALRFQGTAAQGNVARRLIIHNVENGIKGRGTQRGFYYADNMLTGRHQFPRVYTTSPGGADTHGISLFGHGHVVAHNHVSAFANCITMGAEGNRSIDIYGNEIPYSYDDAIEVDTAEGNIRVFRNRLTNVHVGISLQPIFGGPVYLYRNTAYNIAYEQMKFHARSTTPTQHPSGVLALHNTFASPEHALNMEASLANYNSVLMNNIFLGPAVQATGRTAGWYAPLDRVMFDYNGYYPDGMFYFRPPGTSGVAPTLASVFSYYGFERNGRLLSAGTLVNGLVGPASFGTLQTPKNMSLAPFSPALDVAARLPGINDSFSGAAPDLGAQELGCPVPAYGPRPTGVNETNTVLACGPAITNAVPVPISLYMSNRLNQRLSFTFTAADANGWQDIQRMSVLIGSPNSLANSCAIELDRQARLMYLWNDTGTARLGPVAVGSTATVQNSNCAITGVNAAIAVTQSANQVSWRVPVVFSPAYGTQKYLHGKAEDAVSSSAWKSLGFLR